MEYNIVRNAYFTSLTSSGTGNIDLSWSQLDALTDGNLTSSGVTLTSSGILFLAANFSQRIKIEMIRLYANDVSKSSYINFYYKNREEDSYTLLPTYSGAYYFSTMSEPSAPQYVLVTISGIDITLYEFAVTNDEYIVEFGEDGTSSIQYLDSTPIGEEGEPQAVPIYNNGTSVIPADAYVCIDYTGNIADEYIKISASENGTYYSMTDGALIEDDKALSEYRWSMGFFSGTAVTLDKVKCTGTSVPLLSATIPLVSYDKISSASNNLHYDPVRKKFYLVTMDGTPLKLFEYDYINDTWRYISELKAGGGHQLYVTVSCYLNDYVYVMSKINGSSFFKYDLNGPVNNYEDLPSPPTFSGGFSANVDEDRLSMCTDGERYIYIGTVDYAQATVGRNFMRYDTTTSGWSVLSDQYRNFYYASGGGGGSWAIQSITYDTDRDMIYMLSVSEHTGETVWLQRYFVATNIWEQYWLNTVSAGFGSAGTYAINHYPLYYFDNYLYCGPNSSRTSAYRYSLLTGLWEAINVGHSYNSVQGMPHEGYHLCVVNKIRDDEDFEHSVVLGDINDNLKKLVLYPYLMTPVAGTYTTPILELEDPNNSSYFLIQGTAVSGLGSISYDADSYNGTIRHRGSNDAPLPISYCFVAGYDPYTAIPIYRWVRDTDSYTTWTSFNGGHSTSRGRALAVSNHNGYVAMNWSSGYYGPAENTIYIYNRSATLVTSKTFNIGGYDGYTFNVGFDFDIDGGLWGYSNGGYSGALKYLVHLDSVLGILYSFGDPTDFISRLAVEMKGTGVWYTDKVVKALVHKSSNGTTLKSIVLGNPVALCSTSDNGCWVGDNSTFKFYRYDYDGNLIQTVTMPINPHYTTAYADKMRNDLFDGFWYLQGSYVYHVSSGGSVDLGPIYIDTTPQQLRCDYSGCYVMCAYTNKKVYFVDRAAGAVTKFHTLNTNDRELFGVFALNIEAAKDISGQMLLPVTHDPVWGTGGSLEWREVRKDGYFLPKHKYHQVEVTLRGDASLEKILMPPAVKIQDIASKTSKNAYVKTVIPAGTDITDYEARIKTWWGVDE